MTHEVICGSREYVSERLRRRTGKTNIAIQADRTRSLALCAWHGAAGLSRARVPRTPDAANEVSCMSGEGCVSERPA